VRRELLSPSAPDSVRNWVGDSPNWLEFRNPAIAADSSLTSLDPGERDAILLATELHADQLIVDDRQGRYEAQKRGIPVIGTLVVLLEASVLGLLDLPKAVKRLEATTFYIAPEVLMRLLKLH
jgi:predicted nucleic acid-binding protein